MILSRLPVRCVRSRGSDGGAKLHAEADASRLRPGSRAASFIATVRRSHFGPRYGRTAYATAVSRTRERRAESRRPARHEPSLPRVTSSCGSAEVFAPQRRAAIDRSRHFSTEVVSNRRGGVMFRYVMPAMLLVASIACREASQPPSSEAPEMARLRADNTALKAQVGQLTSELQAARSTPCAHLERAQAASEQGDWAEAKENATKALEQRPSAATSARAKELLQLATRRIAEAERGARVDQREVPVVWVLTAYQESPERGTKKLKVRAKGKCFDQWNRRRIEWSADANDSSRAAAAFSGTPLTDLRVAISGSERKGGAPTLVISTHRGNSQFSVPLSAENRNRTFPYDAVMPTFWSEAQLLCD
jgi:hypothetical protein